MASQQILSILELNSASKTLWKEAINGLASFLGPNGESLSFDVPIPGTGRQISLKELDIKITGLFGLAESMKGIASSDLIPDHVLNDLASSFGDIKTKLDSVRGAVISVANAGKITSLDVTGINVTNESGAQLNIAGTLPQLYDSLQRGLSATQTCLSYFSSSHIFEYSELHAEVSDLRNSIRSAITNLNKARRLQELSQERIEPIEQAAKTAAAEVTAQHGKITSIRAEIDAALLEAQTALSNIKSVQASADTLDSTVSAYQEKFNKYDADLLTRNSSFTKSEADLEALNIRFTTSEAELLRLQNRSREVLGEATVAGLSDRFAKEAREIGERLDRAQLLFFAGIILFLLSAGAALGAFPWLETSGVFKISKTELPDDPNLGTTLIFIMNTTVGKIILLLPSLFLLAFSAKWYAEQFRLKAQYSYKYTVAASLPGFKAEANTYSEAITASAFKELLHNPSEPETKHTSKEKLSWFERLMEPHIKSAMEKMYKSVEKKSD